MSVVEIGGLLLLIMMFLLAGGVWIAITLAIVGWIGMALFTSQPPMIWSKNLFSAFWDSNNSWELAALPMFIWMGEILFRTKLSEDMFEGLAPWLNRVPGRLMHTTILGCGIFGSVSGSSAATCATIAKVALPELKKRGYDENLALGSLATAGTLGILSPPSVIMVIYALMTEVNIGAMFAAGLIPGVLATLLLMAAVAWQTWRDPKSGPRGERTPWPERLRALQGVWGVVVLFVVVMGGIYGGVFTATEGASMGAFGAFVFAIARRALTRRTLLEVLVESARTTAMLFGILIGALIFANFVNFTTMPDDLKTFVSQFQVHPMAVIVAICAIYVLLGTAMEELSMILLTVPVLFPLVVHLGFDPIWFGILVVVVVEIGLISPPVGMNLFVLRTLLPHVSTLTIYRGVAPFVVADVIRLAILIAFPVISTWLPGVLFK